MAEAGDEAGDATAQAANGEAEFPAQLVEVVAAAVLELTPFEQVPDALVRVEVGRVRRQTLKVQPIPRTRGEKVFHRATAMNGRTVPNHEQLAAHLAQQLAQEGDDRGAAKCVRLDMGEEAAIRGERADHRQMVMGERRAQHGGLAHRGIRARQKRQEIEAGFVYKEDRAVLGLGFT